MEILNSPNKVLNTKCPEYDFSFFDTDLENAKEMVGGMLSDFGKWHGVGLAAPQVGISRRFFVMAPKHKKGPVYFCFDPKIINHGRETISLPESCLSALGKEKLLERWAIIDVQYFDENKVLVKKTLKRWEARIFQHEFDHLEGIICLEKKGLEN